MKRKFKNFALTFWGMMCVVALISCNDEDEIIETSYKSESVKTINQSTKAVAYNLAQAISKNPQIVKEIHRGISEVTRYGVDENLALFDIANTFESKFIDASKFTTLQKTLNESSLKELGFSPSNHYDNLNLYWGYSEKWDGKTLPIICYIDNSSTEVSTKGYRISNNTIREVEVSEKQFEYGNTPVIVINIRETNYKDYPNFKKGEYSRDKTT